jgi:hypothetical protein
VEPVSAAPEPAKQGSGLFGLGDVFQMRQPEPERSPLLSANGSQSSSSSEPVPDDPLSLEAERLLSGVPSTIGADADTEGGTSSAPGADDPIAALMAQVAFEEQDVKDTLCEFFDWMAERFESEHWRLTDRQTRMLGRPTSLLLNSLWAKLQTMLPDVLARWCESTPGAMAFMTAAGFAIFPKVMTQVKISRERKRARPVIIENPKPQQPKSAPAPAPAERHGMIYSEGGVQ